MPAGEYSARLESFVAADRLTGASFAYWDGAQLYTGVVGKRNSVTGDPVTADTVMHIGSVTKLLNTVLLLQLADEGRIALDDPVVRHVPELRLRDAAALRRITCAMLVNHTSGIDGDMLADHGPDRERIEDAIERCAALGQVHPPGAAASYCNMGTVIAGYLVQKLRGISWYTLVKTRLYEPLGMCHALADLTDLPRFRHSVGDVTDPVTGRLSQTTRAFLPLSFAPAGSTLMMSAHDLVTFGRALVSGGVAPNGTRILSERQCSLMMSPTAELAMPRLQVGLGWMLLPGGILTHGGSVAGGAARIYAHRSSGRTVALLANCDRKHDVNAFLEPIVAGWTGGALRPPISAAGRGVIDGGRYEGVYESSLMRAEVAPIRGGLTLRLFWKVRVLDNSPGPDAPAAPLRPLGDDIFATDAFLSGFPSSQIRFVRPGSDGRMQFLATDGRLLPRTG